LLYVAEAEGRPVGWAALIPRGKVGWLEDLWVEPAWIGRRVGRTLFERVAAEARQRGARRLEWEAEPNALGFYERMGGAYVRDSEETEWGRVLQVLGVDL
jgi:N-acetylglutamate synthase-like GNAT family acetyltransferase